MVWETVCVASVFWKVHLVSCHNTELPHQWCFFNQQKQEDYLTVSCMLYLRGIIFRIKTISISHQRWLELVLEEEEEPTITLYLTNPLNCSRRIQWSMASKATESSRARISTLLLSSSCQKSSTNRISVVSVHPRPVICLKGGTDDQPLLQHPLELPCNQLLNLFLGKIESRMKHFPYSWIRQWFLEEVADRSLAQRISYLYSPA